MLHGLIRLEDRIVFDGADVAEQGDSAIQEPTVRPENTDADRLLVVDQAVEYADSLAAAVGDGVDVVVYDSRVDTLQALRDMIAATGGDGKYSSIAFATHGYAGTTILALDAVLNLSELASNPELAAFFEHISGSLAESGRIDLLGCDVAAGQFGEDLIATLEEVTGIDFAASDNTTGNEDAGGDWLLETDGVNVAETYFDTDFLADFVGNLATGIFADGNVIHYDDSPRTVDVGDAFRDQDLFYLLQDSTDTVKKLELSFTLEKNGVPVSLADFLRGDSPLYADGSGSFYYDYAGNGQYQLLPGMSIGSNGELLFTLDVIEADSGVEPYGLRLFNLNMWVPLGEILGFTGNGHDFASCLSFASIPDSSGGDVFTLTMSADAYGTDLTPEGRLGSLVKTTTLNFVTEDIVDPTTPVDPTDPVGPTDPVDPIDPVNPSDPVGPIDPVNPIDPNPPYTPTQPGIVDGDDPVDPIQPGDDDGKDKDMPPADDPSAEDGEKTPTGTDDDKAGGTGTSGDASIREDVSTTQAHRVLEEEIVKHYPESMQAEVIEMVTLIAQSTELDQSVFASIRTSITELGETLDQFNNSLRQMLGMLSYIVNFTGDAEFIHWVENIGGSRENLLASSGAHVTALVEAVRAYNSLPPEAKDSIAHDSITELNAAIDDVSQRLRVIISGMGKMTRNIGQIRDAGEPAVLASKLPAIRSHMEAIAEDLRVLHAKRDSMFFELRTAASIAEGQQR